MSSMHFSRTDMMTVRDMIDNAITYNRDEPIVDFNLIETVLYIIARHLNVLERQVKVEWFKYRTLMAKYKAKEKDKKKKKKKTLMAITEIKIYKKFGKDQPVTDSTTEPSTSFKAHQRRRKSRSVSKGAGAPNIDDVKDLNKRGRSKSKDDDEPGTKKRGRSQSKQGRHQDEDGVDTKRRGRSKDKDGEYSKSRGQSQDTDDDGLKQRRSSKGKAFEEEGGSKKRGRSKGRPGEDVKEQGRSQDEDDEGSKKRRRSKHRASEDSKKHGYYQDEDEEGSVKHGRHRDKHDDHSRKHGRHGGRYDTDGYDEDTTERGGHTGTYDEDSSNRGRHRMGHDEHSEKRERHGGRYDDHSGKRGHHGGGFDEDKKNRGRYKDEDDDDSMEDYRGGHHDDRRGRYKDGDSRKQGRRGQDVHEKILVVSRSSEEDLDDSHRSHRRAVVTQDQFDYVLSEVRKLQAKYGVVSNVDAPWSNLHKPTTLTEPRAAMNMATRLDAAHKRLNQMMIVVTKFASKVPGINIDGAADYTFASGQKEQASRNVKTSTSGNLTEAEETVLDECLLEEVEIEKEDLATWHEFTAELNQMQQVVCDTMSSAATNAFDTAKRASKLLKINAPKLSDAQVLNVKFAKLRILVDQFSSNATVLDVKMAAQMGDAQERVSQLQFEVETIIERIDEHLAHPGEDPTAVAAIKEDFSALTGDLIAAQKNQEALKELHDLSALEFERIRKKIEVIQQVKTTREQALDALKLKARVTDVNSFLSTDQLYAVVGFLQREITQTHSMIDAGETMWQNYIDDHVSELFAKGDRVQVTSLQNSLGKHLVNMDSKVNTMLDIVGAFPVPFFKKKLLRDRNCLCCGAPANVKISGKYGKLAKRMKDEGVIKHAIKEKEPEPCIPGQPIPHLLDPRALVCGRFCGASISKTGGSLSSMGVGVADLNPTQKSDTVDINTVQKKVHLTCTPCTHSEEFLFK